MAFDVQYHFRLTFCCSEKLVRLKTLDRREGVKRIRLCHRDHIVRNWIDAKLPLEEVLHHVLVTKLGEIGDAIDIICKVGRICQAEPGIARWERLFAAMLFDSGSGFDPEDNKFSAVPDCLSK